MNPTNLALAWLQENLNRLFLKSHMFYQVWTVITGILLLIVGLPQFLTTFNIHLPHFFHEKLSVAVSYCAAGAFVMSLLSAKGVPVGVDQSGQLIKQTDFAKLPFTAMKEEKVIEKMLKEDEPVQIVKLDTTSMDNPLQKNKF